MAQRHFAFFLNKNINSLILIEMGEKTAILRFLCRKIK